MNVRRRLGAFLLMFLLCVGMLSVSAFAASTSQDGLKVTLSTDKEKYSQNEKIVTTLTVENTNDTAVSDVTLENLVPDGYKLADKSEATKQVQTLKAGETVSLTVTYAPEKEQTNQSTPTNTNSNNGAGKSGKGTTQNNTSKNGNNPGTGDNSNLTLWAVLLVLAGVGIVVTVILRKKSGKKILSLFLCMTLGGTAALAISLPANAVNEQSKSLSISENIFVDKATVKLSATIKYEVTQGTKPAKPENPSSAEEYYWNNSEVLDVINAKESTTVLSEAEIKNVLEERGFVDYPIIYYYTMDGEFVDDTEISEDSTDKHPTYQTHYMSETGDIWSISVVNGMIIANPASFNLDSELTAQLLISESEKLTSYDNATNKFFVTIPYESEVIVKTVDKIDAETLDRLTVEEINKL